jgi:hypothetical protein
MKREDSDGQGFQLAAGAERPDLSGDAAVLAEGHVALDHQRQLENSGGGQGELNGAARAGSFRRRQPNGGLS